MYNFCTKCGTENKSELGVCEDCSLQAQPQINTEKQPLPFAEPPPTEDFFENQTQQFGQQQSTQQIQRQFTQPTLQQTHSQCPRCGGAGGVYPKSEISPGGIVYLVVMLCVTFFFFMIFFPCAIIPFALVFLVFLFKDKYFACVNCGQKVT